MEGGGLMPTLEIEGRKVKVDDAFLSLSPEEQQKTVEEIAASFAPQATSSQQDAPLPYGQPPEGMVYDENSGRMMDAGAIAKKRFAGPVGQSIVGGAQFAAGYPIIGGLVEDAGKLTGPVQQEVGRQAMRQFRQENPKTTFGLNIAGGVAGTAPLVAAAPGLMGASPGGFWANTAKSALSGGAIALPDSAIRSDFDPKQTAIGTGVGVLGGAAAPAISRGIGYGARTLGGFFGIGNKSAVRRALGETVRQSGKTVDDVADDLVRAGRDGQPDYAAVDALGHSGQRQLSGIMRQPGEARSEITEKLLQRQTGQAGRLTNTLAEGFGAPDTALQRQTALTAARKAAADINYAASRNSSGAVDVQGAIDYIDDIVRPGVQRIADPADDIAGDGIENILSRYRKRMTDGRSVLTDYNQTLNLKMDIGDAANDAFQKGKGRLGSTLKKMADKLDEALEASSPGYRRANDTFKTQSRVIDAIDDGAKIESGRVRFDNSIPAFNKLTPAQKKSFRVGYVDPKIAKIQNASSSPTTNKVRTLLTEKTKHEFPAFAAPGQGPKMGRRIAREKTMFDTAHAALGGSATAQNINDAAAAASLDWNVFANLFSGRPGAAVMGGAKILGSAMKGKNSKVRDEIAKALMETNPSAVRNMLSTAVQQNQISTETSQAIIRGLMQGSSSAIQEQINSQKTSRLRQAN